MAKGNVPYERIVFPNGTKLLLIPMNGVNSTATSVMVGVGSRYETPNINGISHFLEHMVFKGTSKYPTTDDVNTIERNGGLQNAYTDIDVTNYHNKVLSTDWELALEINKELAVLPLLDQTYVDKERDVILEEMKRYEDEPASKAEEVLHQKMYPGTKLGMRIIGEVDSLKSTTGKELREYHDAWYTPDKMVVVLAGNIGEKREAIRTKVEEWFGGLSGKAAGDIEKVTDKQVKPQVTVVTKPDAQQAHWFLGLRTFGRFSTDRYAWSVFNLLMGVSFTSRLFREIREKRGLCYHIRSSSSNWSEVGYWSIYAGVATDKVEEAVKATLTELAKARDEGITEEEVVIAKKRLKTMLAFRSEDPEFQNEFYGRQEVFGEPILSLDDYLSKIDGVTASEINTLTKKYFTPKTLNMSLVWNKKSDPNLEKLLQL